MTWRPRRLRFWPRSLLAQTLASTALILGLAQFISIILFSVLILRPELDRVARVTAQSVATLSDTMADVSPAERMRLMQRMAQSPYLEIWTGTTPPDDTGPPPRAIERVFMHALVTAMGEKTDLSWRTDHSRKLWIHVYLGPDPYWISIKSPPILGPTGLVVVSGIVAALLALVVAWNLNGKLMRPLNELRSAAETYSLSAGQIALREDGPSEIAALSHSFNLMTERLARADADRALILAGISHDVRTPLAKLKLSFEMMGGDDELRATAQRQIDSIDRILSSFMTFARGFDAEAVSDIDPAALLGDLAEAYGVNGVVISGDLPSMTLRGRPEALRRALINLIENAIRYGAAPIEIGARHGAGGWCFVVRDHGPGVPEASLGTLAEPFVRGDAARRADSAAMAGSGTGLGLAIADKVARLHGGTLTLRNVDGGFEAGIFL